jgi:hypothetical protein
MTRKRVEAPRVGMADPAPGSSGFVGRRQTRFGEYRSERLATVRAKAACAD